MNEWTDSNLGKLEAAILSYNLSLVGKLLGNGSCNLNEPRPSGGQCALIWAIEQEIRMSESADLDEPSDSPITEMLLKHGADPNVGDDEGYTPLDYATGFAVGAEDEPRHPVVVKLLREWGGKRRSEL